MLASLLLIGALHSTPQMTVQAASQSLIEDGPTGISRAVNRMIGGIVGYARWPGVAPSATRSLCIIGQPRLAVPMPQRLPGGYHVRTQRMSAQAAMAGNGCDILFLGRLAASERQRLIQWVRGRPILTLTDDDPRCLYGAMFCLAARGPGLSFSVNLDAIGRGPLRIDPRVLKIGGSEGGAG